MEDSHIALTDVTPESRPKLFGGKTDTKLPPVSVFGVFDGHGGKTTTIFCTLLSTGKPLLLFCLSHTNDTPLYFAVLYNSLGKEVAKFVKLKYPKLVVDELLANDGDFASALRESFHKVDELLEDLVRPIILHLIVFDCLCCE